MFNFHSHTYMCRHAQNTPKEMVLEAIKRGFSSIGISEHYGKFPDGRWYGHSLFDAEQYFSECKEAKEKYGDKIDVKIGVEMDFRPDNCKEIYEEIMAYEPDYIMGSLHFHNDFYFSGGFGDYKGKSPLELDEIIRDYLETVIIMVNTGYVNNLNHFDLYKKFYELPDESVYYPYYKKIAEGLRDHNMSMEFNTHYCEGECLYKNDPEFYMLNLAKEYDIPVIVSADAHSKELLSDKFEYAFKLLKEIGIKTTCRFDKCKVIKEPFIVRD